jgi:PTS system nitrogen regulatory IIA component
MKLSDVLAPENVVLDLDASSKGSLLRTLSAIAAKQLGIGEAAIFTALNSREKLGSTGIGEGIAIPHAAVPDLKKPFALFARLSKPVDFEAIDENPVDIVAVLLVPVEKSSTKLNLLAGLARILRSEKIKRIRSLAAASDVYATITEAEA